jgi:hypothetical protein
MLVNIENTRHDIFFHFPDPRVVLSVSAVWRFEGLLSEQLLQRMLLAVLFCL